MSAWNDNKSNLVLILMLASGGGGGICFSIAPWVELYKVVTTTLQNGLVPAEYVILAIRSIF